MNGISILCVVEHRLADVWRHQVVLFLLPPSLPLLNWFHYVVRHELIRKTTHYSVSHICLTRTAHDMCTSDDGQPFVRVWCDRSKIVGGKQGNLDYCTSDDLYVDSNNAIKSSSEHWFDRVYITYVPVIRFVDGDLSRCALCGNDHLDGWDMFIGRVYKITCGERTKLVGVCYTCVSVTFNLQISTVVGGGSSSHLDIWSVECVNENEVSELDNVYPVCDGFYITEQLMDNEWHSVRRSLITLSGLYGWDRTR